jgi:hypothetical protein
MLEPGAVDPAVVVLAKLAGGGRALELGIGTGRIALPPRLSFGAKGGPVPGPRHHASLHAEGQVGSRPSQGRSG